MRCKIYSNNKTQDVLNLKKQPLKQNKYSPGNHIKIVAMNKLNILRVGIVIVFLYEYFSDIKKKFKSKEIKFFKPIPFKKLG